MSIRIRLAGPSDEAGISALQRLPMQGSVRLSMRMAPGVDDRIVVAERDSRLVAMGTRRRSLFHCGGEGHRVGVLGGMRSALTVLPRGATREMYRLLRGDRDPSDPDWDLTAILEGNLRARRLLEAGLPWLPRYRLVRRMVTLSFRSGATGGEVASAPRAVEVPVGSPAAAAEVVRDPARNTTVEGYVPWMDKIRPVLDRALRLAGRPGLPPVGTVLAEAFATRTVWTPGDRAGLAGLAGSIRKAAREAGAEIVHWGLPADHPDLAWLARHLRAWKTSSRVYQVHDAERIPPDLGEFWPEVSRL